MQLNEISDQLQIDLVRKIAEGGMGIVYEAWDTALNRRVALKVLPAHYTSEKAQRDRFQRQHAQQPQPGQFLLAGTRGDFR